MPLTRMYSRSNSPTTSVNPIYIAGLAAVGATVIGLVFWFFMRMLRKRAARKREENIGAALLVDTVEKHPSGLYAIPNTTFSRGHVDSSILIPEKAIVRRIEPVDEEAFKRYSGSVTFSPNPISFAMAVTSSTPEPTVNNQTSQFRGSVLSIGSGQNRFSLSSNGSNNSQGPTNRQVRQLFNPGLPDELLISTPGEQLTLLQSYDDGWCLVGRENSIHGSTAKSLFRQNPMTENNIELGVVPAWCFIKPVKGLHVERPLRSSSLGISVQLQRPGFSSRDEIISWSNF